MSTSPAESAATTARGEPWSIAASCMIGLMVAGPAYAFAFPIYLKPITAEMGWGRTQILLGLSAYALTATLLTPLIGFLIDRIGAKRVSLIGCIGLPAALAMLSLTGPYSTFVMFTITGGVFAAFASPTAYMAVLPQWFKTRLGTAIAVAATGIGLAGIVSPLAANALVGALGWREAVIWLAAGMAVIGITNNLFLLKESPQFAVTRSSRAPSDAASPGETFSEGARTSDFWKMAISFLLVVSVVSGCNAHLVAMAIDRGFSATQGAIALSAYGACSIIARFATGLMLDRFPVGVPATLFFSGTLLAVFMLWTGQPFNNLTLIAGLLGLAAGSEGDLIPFVVRRRFGMRAFGRLLGLMYTVFQVGPIFAPLALAVVYDRFGSYDGAFPVLIAIGIVAIALFSTTSIAWSRSRGTH